MQAFHGYSRRSERDTIVSLLERARSKAISNVSQNKWGVCLDTTSPTDPNYEVFSGSTYASAIAKYATPGNPGVTITDTSATPKFACTNGGVVFDQLTGDTGNVSITVTQGSVSTIAINNEGAISW
jgi:hypothetical protein